MNLSFTEMAFIFVLALLIFGPKKLPEIGRQIGRALAEFKRASNEFKSQLESEMQQLEIEEENKRIMAAHPMEPPPGSVPSGGEASPSGSGHSENGISAKAADA